MSPFLPTRTPPEDTPRELFEQITELTVVAAPAVSRTAPTGRTSSEERPS
ncbi:hypothetical protein ACFXPN_04525 [Streptomyces griseorubiginosus]